MKKQLLLVTTLLLCAINALGQRLVPEVVVNKHTFIVHSLTYSLFSNEYRHSVKITLPANTDSWYYNVSTYNLKSSNETSTGSSLLSGLSSLAGSSDPVAGIALSALSSQVSTVTESECHIYMLDESEEVNFMNYDSFRYYAEGTRKNFNGGITAVKDKKLTSGTLYLGFENPKTKDGVKVELEVVALVRDNNATIQNQASDVTITNDSDVNETEINIYNSTDDTLLLYIDGEFMEEIPPMESTSYDTENATYKVKCLQKGGTTSYFRVVKFTKNGQSAEIIISK